MKIWIAISEKQEPLVPMLMEHLEMIGACMDDIYLCWTSGRAMEIPDVLNIAFQTPQKGFTAMNCAFISACEILEEPFLFLTPDIVLLEKNAFDIIESNYNAQGTMMMGNLHFSYAKSGRRFFRDGMSRIYASYASVYDPEIQYIFGEWDPEMLAPFNTWLAHRYLPYMSPTRLIDANEIGHCNADAVLSVGQGDGNMLRAALCL